MKPKPKGFTLVELLIVFSILVFLALLGFIAWQNQAAKARDARRKADLKRLSIAFEDYYADAEAYPLADIITHCGGAELFPYLAEPTPCDPKTRLPYCYIYDDDDPIGQEFRLLANLENDSDPEIGKLGCAGTDFCGFEAECNTSGSGFGLNFGFSSSNIAVLNPNTPFNAGPSPATSPLPSFNPSGVWACQPNTPPTSAHCENYPPPGPAAAGCADSAFSDVDACVLFCATAPSQYWCDY